MIKKLVCYSIIFCSIFGVNCIRTADIAIPRLYAAGILPLVTKNETDRFDNDTKSVIIGKEKDHGFEGSGSLDCFAGECWDETDSLNLAIREFTQQARLAYTMPELVMDKNFIKSNLYAVVISLINDVELGVQQYRVMYLMNIGFQNKENLLKNFSSSTEKINESVQDENERDSLLEKEALFEFSYKELKAYASLKCANMNNKIVVQAKKSSIDSESKVSLGPDIELRSILMSLLAAMSPNIWIKDRHKIYIVAQTKKTLKNGEEEYSAWDGVSHDMRQLVYQQVMKDLELESSSLPEQPYVKKSVADKVQEEIANEAKKSAKNNMFLTKNRNILLLIGFGVGMTLFAYLAYHFDVIGKMRFAKS